jgi:hypothetical protein
LASARRITASSPSGAAGSSSRCENRTAALVARANGGSPHPPGESEVGQVDVVALIEKDVRGLDVAMDETAGVGGIERIGDLSAHRDRSARTQGSALQ